MSLIVEPIWSWPWVVLVETALVVIVWTTYGRRIQHQPIGIRRLLIGLRLVAVLLLLLAILRPAFQWPKKETESALLIVATDVSRSMTTPDGPGGVTRRAALLNTLQQNNKQLKALGKNIEIHYFDFAKALKAVEQPSETADGEETAIGAVLEALLKESQTRNVAGVVLMSDGAQRASIENNVDPRLMARRMAEIGLHVYTVGFGGEGITENSVDLAIDSMLVDPVVFEKKVVPVTIKLRVQGAAGRELTVRLQLEDRYNVQVGKSGEMKPAPAGSEAVPIKRGIRIESNNEVKTVELSFIPDLPGEFKLAVQVDSVAGELKLNNNQRETIITVQQGGIRVAYFDQIRPEITKLRAVNRSDKIQLDYFPVRLGRNTSKVSIDQKVFRSRNYDAYIIGDVPAAYFGNENLTALAGRVNNGAGLLMMGGFQSYDAGGYASSPLANYLPVEMQSVTPDTKNSMMKLLHYDKPLKMQPTRSGLKHYLMQIDSPSKTAELWKSLPPLQGANRLKQRGRLSEVLATSAEGYPLLIAQPIGRARVAALAVDTTWLWYQAGYEDAHQRFWRQMILWLAHKEADKDQPVWVHVNPRNYSPKQEVALTMGARDATGQPVNDAKFAVTVINPEKQEQQVTAQRSTTDFVAKFSDTEKPGDYWVRVEASRDGQPIGFNAWTRFIVDARDRELDNPAADLTLLQEIATITGAETLLPEQLQERLNIWLKKPPGQTELISVQRITLWGKSSGYGYPYVCLFVSIMSLEWWLRKKRGLV